MALLIMLILVPIILGLSMSFVDPIIRSLRSTVNDQKTLLAKTIADNMFEIALWESRGAGTGANMERCFCESGDCLIGDPECAAGIDFGFGKATGTWEVRGSPSIEADNLIDGEYTIPAPGTGNAGGDYCSGANPVVDDAQLNDPNGVLADLGIVRSDLDFGQPYEVLDWPCHWNKLREGESVSIPLFTDGAEGYKSPAALGLDNFQLRIRPACDPDSITLPSRAQDPYKQQICNGIDRYELDSSGPDGDAAVIVLWEITGKDIDENGEHVVLSGDSVGAFLNSFFDVFTINEYKNRTVFIPSAVYPLNMGSNVKKNGGNEDTLNNHLDTIYKPHLNLLGIYSLKENGTLNSIPYLEYQFKAPIDLFTDAPIASTTKVVKVNVMIDGGYSETLEKTIEIPKSVSGFVIQQ